MTEKRYALTLLGATGFTGRLAALYLTKQYKGGGFKWAIAGRSKAKLEAIRQECEGIPEVVVADTSDHAAVRAMVAQTKVVITCAGPFQRYGTPVVAACAELGVDYCDITGEVDWVRQMIELYDDTARKSGARIVHLCGHDSVPWDLSVLMLANRLREKNPQERLASVDFFDDIVGQISGGTLETICEIMFGAKPPRRLTLGYDPMLKDGDKASSSTLKASNVNFVSLGGHGNPHRTLFVMAAANACAVRRSNAVKHYGDRVVYREGQAFKSLMAALCWMGGLAVGGILLVIPPTRWLLRRFVLPKPGEGPSEDTMARGYLTVTGEAKGTLGGRARATIHFPVDAGYKDTARMLVESGLSLALENALSAQPGGVLTPAACQGEVLLKRLVATGTTFKFHDEV